MASNSEATSADDAAADAAGMGASSSILIPFMCESHTMLGSHS